MLTLHIGMPKTATTAIQRLLAANVDRLESGGVDYPKKFRNAEGIAHHGLAEEIVRRQDSEGEVARDFLAYLHSQDSDILISSEAFTNALDKTRLPAFEKFVSDCSAVKKTRIVMVLRRVDAFIESMYLHGIKVGEVGVDFNQYVNDRKFWAANMFGGLATLRRIERDLDIALLKYEPANALNGRLCAALNLPEDIIPEQSARENAKLGLKAQIFLLYFDFFCDLMGLSLDRRKIVRLFSGGGLRFEDDVYSYRLMPENLAATLSSDAIEAAKKIGIQEYVDYFGSEATPKGEHVTLDQGIITVVDLKRLKALIQAQSAQRSPKPA